MVWPNRPHVFGESGQLKRIFSKTLSSQSGDFENAGHSFTGGRTGKRIDVFEHDDAIHHLLLA